jgi:glycosyltransferase involved in cell wall biosynthesis
MNLFGKIGKSMKNNLNIEISNISVVIPNWNGAKTLENVIKSCINQTLKPIEVLICDDGSTDNSKEVVDQINNDLVKWIPLPHSGTPAIPRNNGIKISKGEWIAFCDSDDEWLPEKLEKQIKKAYETKYQAICTNAIRKVNGISTIGNMINYKKEKISFNDLLNSNSVVCSSSMIHKSVLEKVGGFSETIEYGSYADFICWLRITTQTNFAFINEPFVIYDDHPETSMRKEKISDIELKENAFKNF